MHWNWQIDPKPGSPEHNMAVDTALLASLAADSGGCPTVRVYQWDRAAVSIGRLQREDPVRQRYPGLPIVRRPTGGRAVLHGEDLTISVVLRLEWLPAESRSVLASYRLILGNVAAALRAIGVDVCPGTQKMRGQSAIVNCFDLSAGCDLVDSRTGAKLLGSAQRREGAALLQQMSLPMRVIFDLPLFLTHLRMEFEQS
jgi:lipoate-protein ligase A